MYRINLFLITLCIFSSSLVYGGCVSDFNKGVKKNKNGFDLIQEAKKEFSKAMRNAKNGNSDDDYICKKLNKSHFYTWMAAKQFLKAKNFFSEAYYNCSGQNEAKAKRNIKLNQKNYKYQRLKVEELNDILNNQCGEDLNSLP